MIARPFPKFLSLFASILLASMAFAQNSPLAPSFFGMHEHRLLDQSEPWPVGPGGAKTIGSMRTWDMETLTGWFEIEPARGSYNWSNLDALLAQAQANGADVVYTFGWTPQWAIGSQTCWNQNGGYTGSPSPGCAAAPASMTDWDNFVTALATHAKGKIALYEIWNEPNVVNNCNSNPCGVGSGLFWNGPNSQEDMADLVTMTQHAVSIIKGIDPAAKVSTPTPSTGDCSTGTYNDPNCWLNDFYNAGGPATDVVSFHGYVGRYGQNPAGIVSIANEIVSTLGNHGHSGLPLWDTESSNCSTATPEFVGQFELQHVFSPVARHYWYAWDQSNCGGLWGSTLNSAGIAYANVYSWLVGASKTQSTCSLSATVYSCGLTLASGNAALAVWNTSGSSSYTPAAQYTNYKDLSGNTHSVSGAVTIGTEPILFVGNSGAPTPPTGLVATVN